MTKSFEQDLVAAMSEAAAHAQGKSAVAREHIIDVSKGRHVRKHLRAHQKGVGKTA